MAWISDHKNQQKKVWWEWRYSFLLSHPHELGHFWPFFIIKSQGIELTKTLLFILKVLWCSNNLMQKMTSITPHSDLDRKSVQKIRFCLKIYQRLPFIHHRSLKFTFVPKIAIFSFSSNKYIFWPFYLMNYKKI
jgi:hypothetical protein